MSQQIPSAGVGGSSTASVTTPPLSQVVDSNDPAWKHCTLPDVNKKHWQKCNYCGKICKAGITRVKFHLSQITNCGVTACKKVPSDVRLEMIALLLKSAELKEKKIEGLEALRSSVDLDHSDGENETDEDNKKEMLKLFRSDELHEIGYLDKDKGKIAHKTVQSETFWKGVGVAVNYFEPMANVLRRMDSDVPAMGFFHGCMLDAKKEIAASFDNDDSRFKCVIDIIDKRWDSKLKSPLHLAGYFLNPYYYYSNKVAIERDGSFRAAVIQCITRMIGDQKTQDELINELDKYEEEEDSFGMDIAVRQRRRKNFSPAKWWLNYGTCAPKLKDLAMKILSLTCSSSACERNWSAFEQVHTKKRSRLLHDRMRDLVFIKFNSRMKHKRENKSRDPIEKTIVDVLEDENNEFITGIVGDDSVDEHVGDEDQGQQERASTSQAQEKKKKRPTAHLRKKRKKSVQSLLNSIDEEAILSASSDSSSSESEDESPSSLADSY